MAFKKGRAKTGGRKPGGSKAQIELKAAILGALAAVDGQAYLERVAQSDPRTFCSLLGRVLPMTVVGDATQPVQFQVTLAFGQPTRLSSDDDMQARIPGSPANGKALVHMRSS